MAMKVKKCLVKHAFSRQVGCFSGLRMVDIASSTLFLAPFSVNSNIADR